MKAVDNVIRGLVCISGFCCQFDEVWGSMLRGTIKKVVRDRGFGFILSANKGPDVFFHVSTVEGRGFDSLEEGQTVDYDLLDEGGNGKGPRAKTVHLVD